MLTPQALDVLEPFPVWFCKWCNGDTVDDYLSSGRQPVLCTEHLRRLRAMYRPT